jgi:hypothetical protein
MALKVALMCDSPLLKRAMERFLGDRIVPYSRCDMVISDCDRQIDKPILLIGEKLPKPFSRAHLQMALERFTRAEDISLDHRDLLEDTNTKGALDQQVEGLVKQFAAELLTLLQRKSP